MTRFMKAAAVVVLVLGIIVSIYLGIKIRSFLYFLLYSVITGIAVLPWFVMVEISEKVDYLSRQISRAEKNLLKNVRGESSSETGSGSHSASRFVSPASPTVNGKWICPECSEINLSSRMTCKSCGHSV